jgi:hypothetical protein
LVIGPTLASQAENLDTPSSRGILRKRAYYIAGNIFLTTHRNCKLAATDCELVQPRAINANTVSLKIAARLTRWAGRSTICHPVKACARSDCSHPRWPISCEGGTWLHKRSGRHQPRTGRSLRYEDRCRSCAIAGQVHGRRGFLIGLSR